MNGETAVQTPPPADSGNGRPSRRVPLVRYRDETPARDCPYGEVQRLITGGEGGVANIHVVRVTKGEAHVHEGYDEAYYVLSGRGKLTAGDDIQRLCPGAAAVIPAGTVHALEVEGGEPLEFVIFGVPPLPLDDPRARPHRPEK